MEQKIDLSVDQIVKFRKICQQNRLHLTEDVLMKLAEYVGLLKGWNAKINLISRRDTTDVWFSHILHSVSILFFIDIPEKARILDLGTGGGLPGIPISLVRPDLNITLLDSIRKKTTALQGMVERLGIQNARVHTGRAEDSASRFADRKFDTVLTRAVAPLADLIRWARPLTAASAQLPFLMALKGGDLTEEIASARRKTGATSISVLDLVFEGSEEIGLEEKKLVIVQR